MIEEGKDYRIIRSLHPQKLNHCLKVGTTVNVLKIINTEGMINVKVRGTYSITNTSIVQWVHESQLEEVSQ